MLLKELFLKEDNRSVAVFAFGRFNPPTIGHQKLLNKVQTLAQKFDGKGYIFLSHKQNNKTDPLSFTEKQEIIKAQFKTNTTLKQMLLGCVIGLLTTEEFNYYNANTSNINKRIFSMLKERLFDQWK